MKKESFNKRSIVMLNVYSPTNSASKNMKQKLIELQGEIGNPMITVRDFNTLLMVIDRRIKQLDR